MKFGTLKEHAQGRQQEKIGDPANSWISLIDPQIFTQTFGGPYLRIGGDIRTRSSPFGRGPPRLKIWYV